jgi:hypothetical protein
MDFQTHNFRHALEILRPGTAWQELEAAIRSIQMIDIVDVHNERNRPLLDAGKAGIAEGQSAINELFRRRLVPAPRSWRPEPTLFAERSRDMSRWKMDFVKDRAGLEVSFNHAEAIAWTFTRLNIAGESEAVVPDARIDVGVAVFATSRLKQWARMDAAVGTFDRASLWLTMMKPIMPIPILVIGLDAATGGVAWDDVSVFRGTGVGTRRGAAVASSDDG